MSQRQQLYLAFSNNTMLSSRRPKKCSISSSLRSANKGSKSQFIKTMCELERVNPVHARVLEKLARQMITRSASDVSTE